MPIHNARILLPRLIRVLADQTAKEYARTPMNIYQGNPHCA